MLSSDLASKLVQKGFAVPGMEELGREVKADNLARCTQAAPCDFDAASFLGSVLQTAGGAALFVLLLSQAFAFDEGALQEQAARSQQRRERQLRAFAEKLRPLQDSQLGWRLVDEEGMPTADAFSFLAIAVGSQIWLAWSLSWVVGHLPG